MLTTAAQSVFMSNGLCATRCTADYAYAVIIGQSCYCSDNVPATQVNINDCHDPCPGYPPEFCGNATSGYYAYFNLGRAASATVQSSTAALSSSSIVAGSVTAASTSASTGTSPSIVAIQQYIQSALSTQTGPDATDGCFLNVGNTRYTSPSWYQNAPTQVQSYFSSRHQDTSATCAALADTLFASPTHHGLSSGAKAGIIVGSILGGLLIAGLIIFGCLYLRRRKRNRNRDGNMDEKAEGVAAARMPNQSDIEHSSEHDLDDHSVEHNASIDHQQPASRTAMAAAALAWGREHPHDPSAHRVAANENSITESQASSVYETPYEASLQQQMFSDPAVRTSNEQDYYILQPENPYQPQTVPGSSGLGQQEKKIPRKPVGILKNKLNDERPRDSEQYTFYDEHAGEDYPFHAR
jgi:hypothetical protein